MCILKLGCSYTYIDTHNTMIELTLLADDDNSACNLIEDIDIYILNINKVVINNIIICWYIYKV